MKRHQLLQGKEKRESYDSERLLEIGVVHDNVHCESRGHNAGRTAIWDFRLVSIRRHMIDEQQRDLRD